MLSEACDDYIERVERGVIEGEPPSAAVITSFQALQDSSVDFHVWFGQTADGTFTSEHDCDVTATAEDFGLNHEQR